MRPYVFWITRFEQLLQQEKLRESFSSVRHFPSRDFPTRSRHLPGPVVVVVQVAEMTFFFFSARVA